MKKNKNRKKVKNLLLKVIIAITVIAIIGIGVYYFLTAEDEESSLTLLEKQWIEKNKTTLIDIEIPNNIYVLSESGNGALFTFLNEFEETTGLNFNRKPYNYPKADLKGPSFVVLQNNDIIENNDILVFEDTYVLLGKNDEYISNLNQISGSTVGILSDDSESITANNFEINITLNTYNNISDILTAVKNGSINYAAVPRYTYLENIVSEEGIFVNYNLTNISNKVVLRLGTEERLNNILEKSVKNWLNKNFVLDFEQSLMNFYGETAGITELEKSSLTSRVYKYGYVKNVAYNVESHSSLYGVAGEYINTLTNMLNMEFKYIEYNSQSDLETALKNGSVDVAYINFDYENNKYLKTSSSFDERLVAVSNEYIDISNKSGLINKKLYLLKDNYLYDNFKDNYNVKTMKKYSEKISEDGIIVLDEVDYLYLKDSVLDNYKYLFTDTFKGNYSFVVNAKNKVLYELLDFVVDNTNYDTYKVRGINKLLNISANQSSFKEIYFIFLAIILLPIIIILLSIIIIKNSKKLKISKKENILKYNDMLTNLKNRNYLNDNIEKWDDTKVYPRTIIIIDLNNLKYVNDNYGHEEGNELIKQAAAVLINTQLEKSEIVRTDGNEFLIYLIGYSKTQVSTYISKLSKEFEKLPYGFGAALGYSVIEDEIKTIDDAINEATIEMRVDKEQNYK